MKKEEFAVIEAQYYSNSGNNPAIMQGQNQQTDPSAAQTTGTVAVDAVPSTKEQLTSDFAFSLQAIAILFFLWAAITWKKKWQQADYISAFIPAIIGFGLLYLANSL